jgi:hypothetical protein
MTNAIAVQPIAWGAFDAWGCEWATDMDHAYRIAQLWGEECMIWRCPPNGDPIRWCRTGSTTDAIADLVFGVA